MTGLPCPHCNVLVTQDSIVTNEEGLTFHKLCMEKQAVQPITGMATPRYGGSKTPHESLNKQQVLYRQEMARKNRDYQEQIEESQPGLLTPNILLPAIGTLGGALTEQRADDEEDDSILPAKLRGMVRGGLIGGGAALGQTGAGLATQGDLASRIGGGAAGSVLGYLLSRGLLKQSDVKPGYGKDPIVQSGVKPATKKPFYSSRASPKLIELLWREQNAPETLDPIDKNNLESRSTELLGTSFDSYKNQYGRFYRGPDGYPDTKNPVPDSARGGAKNRASSIDSLGEGKPAGPLIKRPIKSNITLNEEEALREQLRLSRQESEAHKANYFDEINKPKIIRQQNNSLALPTALGLGGFGLGLGGGYLLNRYLNKPDEDEE
jgi:hypothetical protein